jgi:cyclophilin family peptidyl-prolyl cis-trans isomerase
MRIESRALRSPLALLTAVATMALGACGGARAAETVAVPDAEVPFVPNFAPDSALVRLVTTRGEIDVMLRGHWAPLGSRRAYEAMARNYYDGARFFRTIRGFVSQFGIAADSARTNAWRGQPIADDPVTQTNRRGTLVFAAGGPNTRTVQLFFNLRDNARLDGLGFAPIGEIVRGWDALDSLYAGYGDGATAPQQDRLTREGETYLAAEFPLLDKITRAYVVRTWPAPPRPTSAATPATSTR